MTLCFARGQFRQKGEGKKDTTEFVKKSNSWHAKNDGSGLAQWFLYQALQLSSREALRYPSFRILVHLYSHRHTWNGSTVSIRKVCEVLFYPQKSLFFVHIYHTKRVYSAKTLDQNPQLFNQILMLQLCFVIFSNSVFHKLRIHKNVLLRSTIPLEYQIHWRNLLLFLENVSYWHSFAALIIQSLFLCDFQIIGKKNGGHLWRIARNSERNRLFFLNSCFSNLMTKLVDSRQVDGVVQMHVNGYKFELRLSFVAADIGILANPQPVRIVVG